MRRRCLRNQCAISVILVLLMGAGFLVRPVIGGDASPPAKGKLVVDRAWAEDVGGYRCSYALISWSNSTDRTFQVVTIQAVAYDPAGGKINANERSFFAHSLGPIQPGFQGTLKIPVELGQSEFAKMACSVVVAK